MHFNNIINITNNISIYTRDIGIIFYYIYLRLIFLIVIQFSVLPEWLTGFRFGIIAVKTTKVLYYYG